MSSAELDLELASVSSATLLTLSLTPTHMNEESLPKLLIRVTVVVKADATFLVHL